MKVGRKALQSYRGLFTSDPEGKSGDLDKIAEKLGL
jgi:hypothetical protein